MQAGREFKFRAWDAKSEEMYYFDLRGYMYMCEGAQDDTCPAFASDKLMQFTGLCDKNGKEIYEGDVWRNDGSVYVIFWSEEYAGFRARVIKSDYSLIKGLAFTLRQYTTPENSIEIIGNIFENHELLSA